MTAPAELLTRFGSPLYVYDEAVLRARCQELRRALMVDGASVLYAMKANGNPSLLAIVLEEGLGVDAVSPGEAMLARRIGFPAAAISLTANQASGAELKSARELGVQVVLDGIPQIDRFGRMFPGATIGIRINPKIGEGHHDHVITGGPESKFGIELEALNDAIAVANRHHLEIDTLQQHIGSGILDVELLLEAAGVLLELVPRFPDLHVVDFGGGFGVPYRPSDRPFELEAYGEGIRARMDVLRQRSGLQLSARFEPGRFVVAECGTLYVTVTAVHRTRKHTFVGTDSGMNHLLRPALYGSYHRIENLSNPGGTTERVTIAGNICESGDVFARERPLPSCREGDILAIRTAGAYGFAMASFYNLRPRPAEVLMTASSPRLIRPRDQLEDLFGPLPVPR